MPRVFLTIFSEQSRGGGWRVLISSTIFDTLAICLKLLGLTWKYTLCFSVPILHTFCQTYDSVTYFSETDDSVTYFTFTIVLRALFADYLERSLIKLFGFQRLFFPKTVLEIRLQILNLRFFRKRWRTNRFLNT